MYQVTSIKHSNSDLILHINLTKDKLIKHNPEALITNSPPLSSITIKGLTKRTKHREGLLAVSNH